MLACCHAVIRSPAILQIVLLTAPELLPAPLLSVNRY